MILYTFTFSAFLQNYHIISDSHDVGHTKAKPVENMREGFAKPGFLVKIKARGFFKTAVPNGVGMRILKSR